MRARALPWTLAVGLSLSAIAGMGCGPGFAVRGPAPAPIGAMGPGAGAGGSATSSGGSTAGLGGATGGTGGAGSGAGTGATELVEHDHDDELPALSLADGAPESGGINAPEVASVRGTAPLATRYASLDRATCEAELGKRRIAFERVGEARGVIAPLRLKGPIAGVDFHSMLPPAQRRTSPYEIYDCRLVLALDDWARVLARYDVVEVVHYSVYRPPPAKQVLNGAGRRHGGALAIDAAIFKLRDGSTISVEKDFHGRIGSKPCGKNAASTAGLPAPAVTLRSIVCEAADAQLFNVMLTPDYNWPHRNHFHLEVTAGARWVLVR